MEFPERLAAIESSEAWTADERRVSGSKVEERTERGKAGDTHQ